MFDERPIAFAGHPLQRAAVQYLDDTARVGNDALILNLDGDLCHRCPAHSQHIGKQLLRQHDGVARRAIGGLQQPTAKALVDRMQRIAGCRNASLGQEDLVIADAEVSYGLARGD